MANTLDTITSAIKYWAEHSPDKEVFNFVNKHDRYAVYTPSDVYRLAGRFASRIRGYGFKQGDIIANSLPNSPERLITDMGIILAGCVTMNCQILERDGADFWYTANIAGCRAVVFSSQTNDSAFQLFSSYLPDNLLISECVDVSVAAASTINKLIICTRDPNTQFFSLSDLQSSQEADEVFSDPSPDSLAVLFATSGSTGYCKFIPRTHREVLTCARYFKGDKNARYFSDRPFGWMGGFPFGYLAHCSPRILQDKYSGDQALTSGELWTIIAREKCNWAVLFPICLLELEAEFKDKKSDFKLSFIVIGGQPLKQTLESTLGLLTDGIIVTYGSTETAMACIDFLTSASQFKDYYTGTPYQDVQLKIVDEEGNILQTYETGEILVKSPVMMKNYYGQQTNAQVFTHDGWYKTGDRGYLDEAGHLFCFGRAGDVISRGAILVYASWPESILLKIPGVRDVQVVGLPHGNSNERLYACVIRQQDSNLTEENLLDLYQGLLVTTSASVEFRPEITKVFFLDKFPEMPTGKVNKRGLKQIVRKLLEAKNVGMIKNTRDHSFPVSQI